MADIVQYYGTGRRKSAIARVFLRPGSGKFTVNGSRYLLIELPDHGLPLTLGETFHELRVAGMMPILTHPERNATLQRSPERMIEWLENGMLVQITAGSVTGKMAAIVEKLVELIVHKYDLAARFQHAGELIKRRFRVRRRRHHILGDDDVK